MKVSRRRPGVKHFTARDGRWITARGHCGECDGARMLHEESPGLWRLIAFHLPDCPIEGDPQFIKRRPEAVTP